MAEDMLKAMNYPPAVIDVIEERRRQVCSEGWTARHDNEHGDGSMALAAACYACNAATWARRDPSIQDTDYVRLSSPGFRWPWAQKWWKPKSQRRDLVRAAALLIAEIERLDRAALPFNASGVKTVEGGQHE